jgi:hypothetical protein
VIPIQENEGQSKSQSKVIRVNVRAHPIDRMR